MDGIVEPIMAEINIQVDILNKCLAAPQTNELCVGDWQKNNFCRKKYAADHKKEVSKYVKFSESSRDRWNRITTECKFYNNYYIERRLNERLGCFEKCKNALDVFCDFGRCSKNNCDSYCEKNGYIFPF